MQHNIASNMVAFVKPGSVKSNLQTSTSLISPIFVILGIYRCDIYHNIYLSLLKIFHLASNLLVYYHLVYIVLVPRQSGD